MIITETRALGLRRFQIATSTITINYCKQDIRTSKELGRYVPTHFMYKCLLTDYMNIY